METSRMHHKDDNQKREANWLHMRKVLRVAGLVFAATFLYAWITALNSHLNNGASFVEAVTNSAVFILMTLWCLSGSGSAKRDMKIVELKRETAELKQGSTRLS